MASAARAPQPARARVALAGNPNTGKTSLFNRLTGANARVGNYAGVTVEREVATWRVGGTLVDAIDIPGTYSLAARSAEEQVAVRAIFGLDGEPRPHLVLLVVDATQLVRNLYLALQLAEAELPFLIALNLSDVARADGIMPDPAKLTAALGVPCVAVSAHTGEGLAQLTGAVGVALENPPRSKVSLRYSPTIEGYIERLVPYANAATPGEGRALALWSLLSVEEQDELLDVPARVRAEVLACRAEAAATGVDPDGAIVAARYAFLERLDFGNAAPIPRGPSLTQRVDRVLLHPVSGGFAFLLVMGVLFQTLFSWSAPLVDGIDAVFGWLGELAVAVLPAGVFADLITQGLIAGVGGVIVFLPQIMLLFFLLGFLEDSGYMTRVAFLVDRSMRAIGLHGRAFVPMLSGYACAVPAIMATRTLERRRDRLLTMMVVPLMSCSARLPVYTLVVATVFAPDQRWYGLPAGVVAMVAMYIFSTGMALVAAAVLGKTLLKGPNVPLLLELPPYRMPRLPTVLRQMWMRARMFLTEAGTNILAVTILLWALLYFPRDSSLSAQFDAQRDVATAAAAPPEEFARIDAAAVQEQLAQSYGGRLGKAIEPLIAPLGFDWKIGVGVVGAFAAREVFVATMGVIYGIGEGADEENVPLRTQMQTERRADGSPVWTPLVGASLMVFFALSAQCLSTLAVIRRESRSWRWPAFVFVYMTTLAWVASFLVYQGGRLLGLG